MTSDGSTLIRLRDSGRTVSDPAQDVRRRRVLDRVGEDIGRVEDLLIDDELGEVRFLRVEHGGILGFLAEVSFIPVAAITRITADEVQVDQHRDTIERAPMYDPELADQREFYAATYGYYGYLPPWGGGLTPPAAR